MTPTQLPAFVHPSAGTRESRHHAATTIRLLVGKTRQSLLSLPNPWVRERISSTAVTADPTPKAPEISGAFGPVLARTRKLLTRGSVRIGRCQTSALIPGRRLPTSDLPAPQDTYGVAVDGPTQLSLRHEFLGPNSST